MLLLLYLSGGLFLGWSLGANDASNIFGTAVSTHMVRFKTAAIVASIFLILGAVISGSGTSATLGALGSINMMAGAFMVALSSAFTVFWMTKIGLPVSTSQAIVGAIIGWNIFTGQTIDYSILSQIVVTWITSPIIAAIFAWLLYLVFDKINTLSRLHLFRMDAYTRIGLIIVGALGAYSLGANNIANVVGVFIPSIIFPNISVLVISISGTQQLFLLGGIAIASGVFTFSKRVMLTVGKSVLKLNPQTALIVVLAQALVMILFTSKTLETWLAGYGLPTIPLVPLSSSQVVVGAIIGIGLAHGGRGIQLKVLGKISSGWVSTPVITAIITFFALFFLQNVFNLQVY